MDETALVLPTPAKLAIWTDRLHYWWRRNWISVYLAMDPAGDRRRYHEFIYLESVASGERKYLVRGGGAARLSEAIVDARGRLPRRTGGQRVARLAPAKIWGGQLLEPGLWQFVAELRSPDTTEVVKRAHAKFVVAARLPAVLGADGRDTEIAADMTWANDRVHAIRHQVFVNAGATLTIEPGTLVVARGPHAVLVVERGGKVVAQGRPEAPIVMTCDAPVGQRLAGCWGGLVVLGRAPATRGTDLAGGVVPDTRPAYGGGDRRDSSGALRYVRVEFAGARAAVGTGAGLGLYGVGAGTRIDHVQVHASAGDGIRFAGGTANCMYCVSSGAGEAALAWALGWQGSAQYVFLQQRPGEGRWGIAGGHDGLGFDRLPRSHPQLYNLTLVGGPSPAGGRQGGGILLASGSAVTARNLLVTGFAAHAIDVRDNSPSLFTDRTSSVSNAILHASGGRAGAAQVAGLGAAALDYRDVDPLLVNVRYEANPEPRPRLGSPALRIGAGVAPPSDGALDTRAQFIGAFGDSNWLEEWTFFGSEPDYDTQAARAVEPQSNSETPESN